MSEVSGSGLSAVLKEYAISEKPAKKNSALGRDEFLKLLVVQLANQDPLSPQENGDFIAQLAQFSSLEEAQNLSKSFNNFADNFISTQNLQATSLVGRAVHVASEYTLLGNEGVISVLADIPVTAESTMLSVYNDTGGLVESFDIGSQGSGRNEFIWTGQDSNGVRFPPGRYRFVVEATNGSYGEKVQVYLSSNVNSVTIEPNGSLTLNLAGIGPRAMSEVIQIN